MFFFASGGPNLLHPIIKGFTPFKAQDIWPCARKEVMGNEMYGLDPVVKCIVGSRTRGVSSAALDNEMLQRMMSCCE